jgi:hypothetical protein
MNLALTYTRRIVDYHEAMASLLQMKGSPEDPQRFMMAL